MRIVVISLWVTPRMVGNARQGTSWLGPPLSGCRRLAVAGTPSNRVATLAVAMQPGSSVVRDPCTLSCVDTYPAGMAMAHRFSIAWKPLLLFEPWWGVLLAVGIQHPGMCGWEFGPLASGCEDFFDIIWGPAGPKHGGSKN